jgi:hypothetical protein
MTTKPVINVEEALSILRRTLKGGLLRHLPRKHSDARFVLALAASSLIPRQRYSEAELNERLCEWLEGFTEPRALDHVTMRRHMIDEFMLLRDIPGTSYQTNETIISTIIEPDVRSIIPRDVFDEVQRAKEQRRQSHAG